MAKNERNENNDGGSEGSSLAKYTGIAFQMLAVIGVFAYAGYKIDQSTGHTIKWVTAVLSLIGVFIALYIVIKSVKS